MTPYQPKTIVFYAGDNDISKGKSAKIVSEDFRKFAKLTTQALPQTQILFVAIKPSIKRWNLMNKMRVANQMIADFAKSNPKITFIDIDTPMIGSDGKPRQDLFLKDGLHINAKGYQIWSDRVKRELARPVQPKGPKRPTLTDGIVVILCGFGSLTQNGRYDRSRSFFVLRHSGHLPYADKCLCRSWDPASRSKSPGNQKGRTATRHDIIHRISKDPRDLDIAMPFSIAPTSCFNFLTRSLSS